MIHLYLVHRVWDLLHSSSGDLRHSFLASSGFTQRPHIHHYYYPRMNNIDPTLKRSWCLHSVFPLFTALILWRKSFLSLHILFELYSNVYYLSPFSFIFSFLLLLSICKASSTTILLLVFFFLRWSGPCLLYNIINSIHSSLTLVDLILKIICHFYCIISRLFWNHNKMMKWFPISSIHVPLRQQIHKSGHSRSQSCQQKN